MNINRVILTGRLTRDVEVNDHAELKVGKIRLAVDGYSRDGEERPTNFFDVTLFGKTAENCARYIGKGSQIAVDGRLRWREWEKDGQKRQAVEIAADQVQFLDPAKPREGAADEIPF